MKEEQAYSGDKKHSTRMTGLWVFLALLAAFFLVPPFFFRRVDVMECPANGGDCVTRYTEPLLPAWIGVVLLMAGAAFAVGLVVRGRARQRAE